MEKQIGKLFTKWGHVFIFVFSIAMISMTIQIDKNSKHIKSRLEASNTSIIESLTGGEEAEPTIYQKGKASYYAGFFIGRKTANGEIFTKHKYTCAHKKLPFGTKLKVTNLENGKSIIVRVNDRGPFVGKRILDLSYQGAKSLGMINDGVVNVTLEIVDKELSDVGVVDNMNKIYLGDKYAYISKDKNISQEDIDMYMANNEDEFIPVPDDKIDAETGLKIVNEPAVERIVEKEVQTIVNTETAENISSELDASNFELKSLDELPNEVIIKENEITTSSATSID